MKTPTAGFKKQKKQNRTLLYSLGWSQLHGSPVFFPSVEATKGNQWSDLENVARLTVPWRCVQFFRLSTWITVPTHKLEFVYWDGTFLFDWKHTHFKCVPLWVLTCVHHRTAQLLVRVGVHSVWGERGLFTAERLLSALAVRSPFCQLLLPSNHTSAVIGQQFCLFWVCFETGILWSLCLHTAL